MRRILVDRARDKKRRKRGGERHRIDLDAVVLALNTPDDAMLEIDESLELLASRYSDCADLVKLRFFAGLSQGEAANALGIPRPRPTVTGPSPVPGSISSCGRTAIPRRVEVRREFFLRFWRISAQTEHLLIEPTWGTVAWPKFIQTYERFSVRHLN